MGDAIRISYTDLSIIRLRLSKSNIEAPEPLIGGGRLKVNITGSLDVDESHNKADKDHPVLFTFEIDISGGKPDQEGDGSGFRFIASMEGLFGVSEDKVFRTEEVETCRMWLGQQVFLPLRAHMNSTLQLMGVSYQLPLEVPLDVEAK